MPSAQQCSRVLQKQSKGGFGGWLFHREGTSSHPKPADAHATNQNATQATARVAPPSIIHNDTPEYIPRVVSIRAGEGPADYMQEPSARRPTLPTVTPAPRDATVQPLPTVQVLQQPQTVDRQPRAVPRVAASVQLEPPSHASAAQLASPRPWLPSVQWSAEPRPMSPVLQPMSPPPHPIPPPPHPMSPPPHPIPPPPHPMSPPPHLMSPTLHPMSPALHPMSPAPLPPVVPSPMVFPVSLAPPAAVVEMHRQTMPARSHHGPPTQEGPNHTQAPQETPWPNTAANNRPPATVVETHRQIMPARSHHGPPTQEGPNHTQAPQETPWPNTAANNRPPATVVETHRQTMPARSHHGPPTQEGPSHTQALQETPWPNAAANNRPPAPTVPSQLLPAAMNGQRVFQQGAPSAVPDVVSTKHSRQRSAPGAYGDAPPVQPLPPVVPSPMVFPVSLAPPAAPPATVVETHRQTMSARSQHVPPTQEGPSHTQAPQETPWPHTVVNNRPLATVVETQRQTMPARSHHVPPTQEGPGHTQALQETPWPNTAGNNRPPAPTVPSQPTPAIMNGQRVSPQGATSVVPDVVSTKHPRQRFTPGIYHDAPPVPATPSRPIAPDLAAAFPIREDNMETYHRYPTQEERAQEIRASRNIPDQWDRHGHTQESAARLAVSIVPSSSERTPRSTKTSPNLHPRPVHQGTPPKSAPPPVLPPTYQPQASTNLDLPQAHDTAQPGVYNVLPQNLNPSAYPATSIYPSSSPRTHVDASPAINDPPVANAPSNNPSPKVKPGNPSPRSRSQAVAPPQQGPSHPVAVHITNRTPSHETGSTTLLGQTPSSQGSMLLVPMSPTTQHQVIVPRVGNHSVRQSVHIPVPVPDISGDRNTHATVTTPAPRQTSARHYHSASAPTVPISSLLQPPVRSQTQPPPKVPTPLSPTPVRSYSTTQALGDPYATRYPGSGYPGTPAPNARQLRSAIPSPSQESELNTPSSLAISTKLPIVSDEPIAPVMSTQSYQEPKKKSGFFGLFRTKSAAQKRHPHESNLIDATSRAQLPPVKLAPSKTPVPLQYESDSKVGMAPSKLRKARTPAATHPPVFASLSQPPISQPQPPPTPMAPPPTPLPRFEERRISTVPNTFAASFRFVSPKRHRTMSGASAEAVDGTNAGVRLSSTVNWTALIVDDFAGEYRADFSGEFNPKSHTKTSSTTTRPSAGYLCLEK